MSIMPTVDEDKTPRLPEIASKAYKQYASAWQMYRLMVCKGNAIKAKSLQRVEFIIRGVGYRNDIDGYGQEILDNLDEVGRRGWDAEALLQSCWQASLCQDIRMRDALSKIKHPKMRATQLLQHPHRLAEAADALDIIDEDDEMTLACR